MWAYLTMNISEGSLRGQARRAVKLFSGYNIVVGVAAERLKFGILF